MNENIVKLKKWIKQRSPREQLFMFLIGFLIIYFFWSVLFNWPLAKADKRLALQIKNTEKNMEALQKQLNTILSIVRETSFVKILKEYKKSKIESEAFTQNISTFTPNIIPIKDISKVVTDILNAQGDVSLISMKKLPIEPLVSKELSTANLPAYFNEIYKYSLEVEFHSNYFSTISYLQRIEKLSWRVYLDSIDYKVLQYPEADVIVKMHILIAPTSSP